MNILQTLKPSFLLHHAMETIRRFPLVVFISIVAAIFIELTYRDFFLREEGVLSVMTSVLGISSFLSLYLIFENKHKNKAFIISTVILTAGLFLVYKFNPAEYTSSAFRIVQLILAAHLLVSIAPFLKSNQNNNFWFFNDRLFERFFLSAIYSIVLLLGLIAILLTLEGLFNLDFEKVVYRDFILICTFVFHPIHFLGGIPKDLDKLETQMDYPKALRVFCQFLLVPLVSVYGFILICYGLKIMINQDWPRGMLAYLVSAYGVAGIFTSLMIQPLLEQRWAKIFTKSYSVSLLPLSILLLAAVYRRLDEYKLTESRYFVIAFGLWLFGISLYLLFSKKKDIRILPMSLFIAATLTSFGPWGAYGLSYRSQLNRLEKVLKDSKVLVHDKIQIDHPEVSIGAAKEVTSILDYLSRHHGLRSLPSWVKTEDDMSLQTVMSQFKIEPRFDYDQNMSHYFENKSKAPISIEGFKTMTPVEAIHSGSLKNGWMIKLETKEVIILFDQKILYQAKYAEFLAMIGIKDGGNEVSPKPMRIDKNGIKAMIHFLQINGNTSMNKQKETTVHSIDALILQ